MIRYIFRYILSALLFVGFCGVSAFIAWTSGYDFDYRSVGVAIWAAITISFASIFAYTPFV